MSRGQAGAIGRGSGEVTGLPQTLQAAVGPQASSGGWWEPRYVSVLGVDKGRGLGIRAFQEEGPVCAKAQWCDLSGAVAV